MQANLIIRCGQCEAWLGDVSIDTADMPEQLQAKVNKVILGHRKHCRYYAGQADDVLIISRCEG